MRINFADVANNRPVITTSLIDSPSIMYGDTLEFTVFGDDIDLDTLSLSGSGRNFGLGSLGFTFPTQTGIGSVKSILKFIPNCEAVRQKQVTLDFIARDSRCGVSNQTLYVVPVAIQSIPNNSPTVSTNLTDSVVEVILTQSKPTEVKFSVFGDDVDKEKIQLVAMSEGFDLKNVAMNFENKEGIGTVNSVFTWTPNCNLLAGKNSNEFIVKFRTQDNACDQKQDTISVKFLLKDNLSAGNPLEPFNTFTPNEDGINDYFNIGSIPEDNCKRQFVRFEVYNRHGKALFQTSDRNFKWTGDKEPSGDYFYALYFTDEIYKGVIHLVR